MGGIPVERGYGAREFLPEPDPSLPGRVARLEAAVARLEAEVSVLRSAGRQTPEEEGQACESPR